MKKMIMFEPAMCCETGVCGPGVDPELLRVSSMVKNLKAKGVLVERYNLSSAPQAFVDNKLIGDMLRRNGVEVLPVTIVEDKVVKTKGYLSYEEVCEIFELPRKTFKERKAKGCGCKGGCCE